MVSLSSLLVQNNTWIIFHYCDYSRFVLLMQKIQSEYGVLNSKTRITPSEKSYDYAEPTVQPDLTKVICNII